MPHITLQFRRFYQKVFTIPLNPDSRLAVDPSAKRSKPRDKNKGAKDGLAPQPRVGGLRRSFVNTTLASAQITTLFELCLRRRSATMAPTKITTMPTAPRLEQSTDKLDCTTPARSTGLLELVSVLSPTSVHLVRLGECRLEALLPALSGAAPPSGASLCRAS